ncbi:MAG: iron-sulfur cluster biosynthesis family protein, partial [Planktomarina sp.]|nr:iron-sulfur cluster biosynthesis family protein [Planktomarina sp.]
MFGIPGKPAVTLTDAASDQIQKLMKQKSSKGLRIGVKKGGCAGMEYTMEFVDAST